MKRYEKDKYMSLIFALSIYLKNRRIVKTADCIIKRGKHHSLSIRVFLILLIRADDFHLSSQVVVVVCDLINFRFSKIK